MPLEPVGPEYELLGPWWTYDAPSVRVADARHEYVSIWTTGDSGPSVLLVAADHRAWEPALGSLTAHFLVHAVDLRPGPPDVDGVCTALAAVGARLLVAVGDAAIAALVAFERGAADRLVLWDPPSGVRPDETPGVAVAARAGGSLTTAGDALVASLLAC